MKLFIQFDQDKKILVQEAPEGVIQLNLPPLGLKDDKQPMQTDNSFIEFTDGKKKFKIFVE